MSKIKLWFQYWVETSTASREAFDIAAIILTFVSVPAVWVSHLLGGSGEQWTAYAEYLTSIIAGFLILRLIFWLPVRKYQTEKLKYEREIQQLTSYQDRRALLKKIIEAIKKGKECLIVGIPQEPGPTRITGPIDSIGGLIAFAEEIKNENEVEWLCRELVKHGYEHPFTVTDLYCDDFMLGHRLPVLREAGLNEHRPLYGQLFLRFLEERWSEKNRWLIIKAEYNEIMARKDS